LPNEAFTLTPRLIDACERLAKHVYNPSKKGSKTSWQKLYSCLNARLEKGGIKPIKEKHGKRYTVAQIFRVLTESSYMPLGHVSNDEVVELICGLGIEYMVILKEHDLAA
jgi:hypothetical protein